MKRSTGLAVLVTAAVLLAAGNLPRVPWSALVSRWRVPALRLESLRAPALRLDGLHVPALPPIGRLASAAALPALALLAAAALFVLRPRDRRARVYRWARRGDSTSRIAGRARVAKDAVRTLLSPDFGARR